MSTTSFGGGGGGGSYKTTAFIHGVFNSELGVDKSEGAGMCSLRCLFPLSWGAGNVNPLLCVRDATAVLLVQQLSFYIDIAHIYPRAVEAGIKGSN